MALIAAEALLLTVLAVCVFVVLRRPAPSPRRFSPELLRRLAAYGIPMMIGYELAGVILNVGDRCAIYMRMWAEQGAAPTRDFLGQSLRQYVLLTAPVMAGLSAVGSELLPFLASGRYAGGVVVLPSVIAGMVFSGATAITGAGLFLHKRTVTIMALVVSAAVLNVGLNLVLIPRIGILGAALATLIAYATLLATRMYLIVVPVDAGGRLATLVAQVVTGAVVYGAALLAVDRPTRAQLGGLIERLRGRAERR